MEGLWVALGGAVGSWLRFQLTRLLEPWTERWGLPLGTLFVNVMGCFLLVLLLGFAPKLALLRLSLPEPKLRLLIGVGLLGGFTTYSTFNTEMLTLFVVQPYRALMYLIATMLGCLLSGLGARALVLQLT